MKKSAIFLLSHGLALGVGWLAFHKTERSDGGQESKTARQVTKTARTSDREEGRRILAEMRKVWGTQATAATRRGTLDQRHNTLEQRREQLKLQGEKEIEAIRRLSLAVVLTSDPAAELARLATGPEISQTAAFAIAWLRADPVAALRFLEGSEVLKRNSNMTRALEIWVAEAGTETVAGLMEQAPGWAAKLAGVMMKVAAAENPAQLDGLLERLEGTASREQLIEQAFRGLPEEKRPAALEWILGSLKGNEAGRAIMMMALGMDDKVAAKAMLKQAIVRLDPEALKQLKGWGNYGDIMRSGVGPDSPMQERIEARLAGGVIGRTPEERLSNARASIVSQDVSNWMLGEQLGEVMRSGGMGASDLWEQAGKQFPQYGSGENGELLRAVFTNSARFDPEGALKLLNAQGHGDETGDYVLQAAEAMIHSDFERAMKLASLLPQQTMLQYLAGFDKLYRNTVNGEAARRGSFWTDWLRKQPAGLNKDLMLHYTARHYFKEGNETLGADLKNAVKDPTVKSWPKL